MIECTGCLDDIADDTPDRLCVDCRAWETTAPAIDTIAAIDETLAANDVAMAITEFTDAATHPATVATLSLRLVATPEPVANLREQILAAMAIPSTRYAGRPAFKLAEMIGAEADVVVAELDALNELGHVYSGAWDVFDGVRWRFWRLRRADDRHPADGTPFREWLRPRAAEFNRVGQVARYVLADLSIPTSDRESFEKAFWGSANPRLDVVKDVWRSFEKTTTTQLTGATA